MSVEFEVNAKVGVDKNDKPVYRKIGVVLQTQSGLMLKLETIPVMGWDGWAYLRPPQPKQGQQQPPAQRQQRQQGRQQPGNFDDLEDDIPFLFNMNTASDILGAPRSLWRANRAKDGETMLLLRANETDF